MQRAPLTLLAILPLLAGALTGALAAEDIILRDGTWGRATVTDTTADSITIALQRDADPAELIEIPSDRLDAHCFYAIRQSRMPQHALAHLELARFCLDRGLFFRAQAQLQLAEELEADAEGLDATQKGAIRQGAERQVLREVSQLHEQGDHEHALELLSVLLTQAALTPIQPEAVDLLGRIESEAEVADRSLDIEAIEATGASDELCRMLVDIDRAVHTAWITSGQALRGRNRVRSKTAFDAAVAQLALAREEIVRLQGSDLPPPARALLTELDTRARRHALAATLGAGAIELGRGDPAAAAPYAARALQLDPESPLARSFEWRLRLSAALRSTVERR